jgi:hypothetical protein
MVIWRCQPYWEQMISSGMVFSERSGENSCKGTFNSFLITKADLNTIWLLNFKSGKLCDGSKWVKVERLPITAQGDKVYFEWHLEFHKIHHSFKVSCIHDFHSWETFLPKIYFTWFLCF